MEEKKEANIEKRSNKNTLNDNGIRTEPNKEDIINQENISSFYESEGNVSINEESPNSNEILYKASESMEINNIMKREKELEEIYEKKLSELNIKIREYEEMKKELNEKKEEYENLIDEFQEKYREIEDYKHEFAERIKELEERKKEFEERSLRLEAARESFKNLSKQLEQRKIEIEQKEIILIKKEKALESKKEEIENAQIELENAQKDIETHVKELLLKESHFIGPEGKKGQIEWQKKESIPKESSGQDKGRYEILKDIMESFLNEGQFKACFLIDGKGMLISEVTRESIDSIAIGAMFSLVCNSILRTIDSLNLQELDYFKMASFNGEFILKNISINNYERDLILLGYYTDLEFTILDNNMKLNKRIYKKIIKEIRLELSKRMYRGKKISTFFDLISKKLNFLKQKYSSLNNINTNDLRIKLLKEKTLEIKNLFENKLFITN